MGSGLTFKFVFQIIKMQGYAGRELAGFIFIH